MYELSSGYLRDNFGMRVNVFYVPNKGIPSRAIYPTILQTLYHYPMDNSRS